MSIIRASEFDGDTNVQITNKAAANILKVLQKNMNCNTGRGNGKTNMIFEANLAFCKAIELLENMPDQKEGN